MTRCLPSNARQLGKRTGRQGTAIKESGEDVGPRRHRQNGRDIGDGWFCNHISMIIESSLMNKLYVRMRHRNGDSPMSLANQQTRTGRLVPVWLIRIQADPDEAETIIDKVMEVDLLRYGRYERNAMISGVGSETYRPMPNSTSAVHLGAEGKIQRFPCVEIVISLESDEAGLQRVLDAIRDAHHYEEPLIFVQECWASRAAYDPHNKNPYRWWNKGA